MLQYPNKNANKRNSKKVSKYHHQQGAARNDHSSDIYFALRLSVTAHCLLSLCIACSHYPWLPVTDPPLFYDVYLCKLQVL